MISLPPHPMVNVPPLNVRPGKQGFVQTTEQPVSSRMKRCTKCKNTRPIGAFNARSRSPDGLRYWCKKCEAEATNDRRRRKRAERTGSFLKRALVADSLEAISETVHEFFGGDWHQATREIARLRIEGQGRIRVQALEAAERMMLLALSERERLEILKSNQWSVSEFIDHLLELPNASILEELGPERCARLRDRLSRTLDRSQSNATHCTDPS